MFVSAVVAGTTRSSKFSYWFQYIDARQINFEGSFKIQKLVFYLAKKTTKLDFQIVKYYQTNINRSKIHMKQQDLPLRFSTILASNQTEKDKINLSKEARISQMQKRLSLQSQAEGLQMIEQLFKTTTSGYYKDFTETFLYGSNMKIWRKGKMKDVVVYTDSKMSNYLWITTKKKAFLFDLSYTSLQNSDAQLQLSQQIKYYFVLLYFEEKIPFVFENFENFKKARNLFYSAIFRYQTKRQQYPPQLSKLIKYYTMSQLSENKNINTVGQLLKIASSLLGKEKRFMYEEILKQMAFNKIKDKNSSQSFYGLSLNEKQMMQFFKVSCCNQNLKAIYEYYCGNALNKKSNYLSPLMNAHQFSSFLEKEQNQSQEYVEQILKKHYESGLSFYGFCNFLTNKQFNYLALNPPLDENLPLNEYFCYSSHNTYLSGNQITSDSKVQRYLQDLANGLKCLQIDVHSSGEKLIVTHALNGLYLNKQVGFEEVIKEIAHYCNQTSNFYPIILSIQNRANKQSYFKIANIFQNHLGNYLLDVSECYNKNKNLKCHTLAQLKNKIIIKTDAKIRDLLQLQKKRQTQKINPICKRQKIDHFNSQFDQRRQEFQSKVKKFQERKSCFEIQFKESHYLPSDQIIRITSLFKSQEGVDNQNSVGYQSTSLTSRKLQQLDIKKSLEYTKRSFLRIYPLGTEIGSGNYNPIPGLQRGAQIIALNTQTKDDYSWLMMSYFTAGITQPSKMTGYIPKPIHLRTENHKQNIIQVISISVLSTLFNLKIKFFGTNSDIKKNEENKFTFQIEDFEVGFLMFEMENGLKDCIPTRFIREGYRVIVGRNNNYVDCGVRVLLRVRIKYLSINRLSLDLN